MNDNFLGSDWDSQMLNPHHPLTCLGDFLFKFSETAHFPVSIRSIDAGHAINKMKIIMYNNAAAEVRGAKGGEHVGMTIPDLLESLEIEESEKKKELETIEKNDLKAIRHNKQAVSTQITLDTKGFVHAFQRIVTPLAGSRGKPIALATVSIDLTKTLDTLFLLTLYKKYYQANAVKLALHQFQSYLTLEKYFITPLSECELITLLALVKDSRHQAATKIVSAFKHKTLSCATTSSYIALLKNKLKINFDLHDILIILRERTHSQLELNR